MSVDVTVENTLLKRKLAAYEKILKEKENIKVYNKKEIMASHPCKYIFMLGEDEEDYVTEEWLG